MTLSTLVRGQGSTAPLCSNTIGGTVFNDINNNGIFNTADSLGFAGIKVYAFNCAGVKIDSAVTDFKGHYTLTRVTSADDTVRIEFLASTFPYWAKPTYNGADGRTDVQFVKAPNCSVDMGLTNSYCQSIPQLITGCYVNGAINTTTPVGVLVKLNYDGSNKVEISHKVDISAT